jgi:hypothetical protein
MSTEDARATIGRQEEALNAGRVDAGLALFADPGLYNGQPIGRQAIQQLRTILWSAVPDVR